MASATKKEIMKMSSEGFIYGTAYVLVVQLPGTV